MPSVMCTPISRHPGVLALLAAGLGACLIPPDDRILDFPPPAQNRPPRIIENLAQPDRRVTLGTGTTCLQTFSVQVEDPDVDDPIIARWYVDYDATSNPAPYGQDQRLDNNGKALRDEPATLTLAPSSSGSPLATTGAHLVEVLVADGRLVNREPLPHPSVEDGGLNPSYAVTYAWLVTVDDGVPCP